MKKQTFKSGLHKETGEKVRFDLIPYELLIDIADRFAFGAKKYGENNWKKGTKEESHIFKEASLRHLLKWIHNIPSKENHASAAITDIIMFEWINKYKK